MAIGYDPSWDALLRPGERQSVFDASATIDIVPLAVESARLAYIKANSQGDLDRLAAALSLAGFTEITEFASATTNSQAFGGYRPKDRLTLLAFRGTEPDQLQDLLTDAALLPQPWPGGLVHGGFARAAKSLLPDIMKYLDKQGAKRDALLLCGHSLGAALATLFASYLPHATLVTIGSPRVGDAAFATSLSGVNTTRIVDCCDVVTRLPPAGFTWQHVGKAHFITHDGNVIVDPPRDFILDDEAVARAAYFERYAMRNGAVWSRGLADHAPINYVRAFF